MPKVKEFSLTVGQLQFLSARQLSATLREQGFEQGGAPEAPTVFLLPVYLGHLAGALTMERKPGRNPDIAPDDILTFRQELP